MGGAVSSAGGFLGLGSGPDHPQVQNQNPALSQLNQQNTLYGGSAGGLLSGVLQNYQGGGSLQDALKAGSNNFGQGGDYAGARDVELINSLATNPLTGGRFASDQVQSDPILGQLYGKGGLMGQNIDMQHKQEGILGGLQNQGFQMTPEDHSLYGQASGNIARQFGQQGNQMAGDLASRGLSSSGAAGAAFSGLAGNQNEQLAQAQQQIMQQRFQNTQNQIAQQQGFISQLGGLNNQTGANAGNAINQQYSRQSTGADQQKGGLAQAAGLQMGQNAGENSANMASANFDQANKPANFMDYAAAGTGSSIYNIQAAPGKFTSSLAGGLGSSMGDRMGK